MCGEEATTLGEVDDGPGGETSGAMIRTEGLEARGLGTGLSADVAPTDERSPPPGVDSAGGQMSFLFPAGVPPFDSGSVSVPSVSLAMLIFCSTFVCTNMCSPFDLLFQSEHSLSMAWTQASRSLWTAPAAVIWFSIRNLQ